MVTDHRQLVGLFKNRFLVHGVNQRLLQEKTLQFRFTVKYLPGKRNSTDDSLSLFAALRASLDPNDMGQEGDLATTLCAVAATALEQDVNVTMDEETVAKAAAEHPVYQLLFNKDLPEDWHRHKAQEASCLCPYFTMDRLTLVGSLVTYTYGQGSVHLVIPTLHRHRVAAHLHVGHQGLDSMQRRPR